MRAGAVRSWPGIRLDERSPRLKKSMVIYGSWAWVRMVPCRSCSRGWGWSPTSAMINRRRTVYAESLALRRELGDRWGLAQSLDDLGARQLADGGLDAARAFPVEALEIARQTGDRRLIRN